MNSSRNSWLLALGGFALGVATMALLVFDPFGWHLLHSVGGDPSAHAADDASGTLWTCGMHPQVIQEEPGQCPICHMDLTPMASADGPKNPRESMGSLSSHAETAWVCPMHPEIVESEAGSCPICGMDLVAKEAPASGSTSFASTTTQVAIDPAITQNMNLRTALVERRDLRHPIRNVGYLEYDQERMVTVTTKYSGWIEKVHVNYVGEPVRRGQPLFEIYSPELVQTQQELLSALDFARRMEGTPEETRRRAQALVEASRTRLSYWDISAEQIAQLEESQSVFRTLTVKAPSSGVVMKRMAGLEGMAVQPGMETFHIADLSTLWLVVEVFEDQIAWIREGTPAEATFTYFPGESFGGTVRFIEPALSERTRTLRVKIGVPNRGGSLKAGMYATVIFRPQVAGAVLAVPSDAVLRTGERNVAVVADGDIFSPRELSLGHEGEGWVEVLAGLAEGERVVTSAQFLLDSEASVRASIERMMADRGLRRESLPATDPHAGHHH